MKMRIFFTGIISCVICSAYAQYNPYFSLIGGTSLTRIAMPQSISLSKTSFDTKYTTDTKRKTLPYFGIGSGVYIPTTKKIDFKFGVGVHRTINSNAKGEVYKNPSFSIPNEYYGYKLRSTVIVAEAQLLKPFSFEGIQQVFLPYLKFGIGAAIHETYDYKEVPATQTDVPTAPFTNRYTLSRAVQAGAGIALKIKKRWLVDIGYQYSNLGTAKFGISPAQSTTAQLKTNRLILNSLLATVTYVFTS